jgi:SAM-dependent methyltransferase
MSDYRELLIGCGRRRDKRVLAPSHPALAWRKLTTLDFLDSVGADLVLDLEKWTWPVFADDSFDEIHAYEVLEHLGRQGDFQAFFGLFSELWRILKPGAYLLGTCPSRYSPWLWGDPGHCRAILPETLHFLSQLYYRQCDGDQPTMASDYRPWYRADFDVVRSDDDKRYHVFALQAVKPARGREKA